jgi:hypothetical protein
MHSRRTIQNADGDRRRRDRRAGGASGSRRLVVVGVIALFLVAAGLLTTIRNVGTFVDRTYADLQRGQVESLIGGLVAADGSLSREAAAVEAARLLSLPDARIGREAPADLSVPRVDLGSDAAGRSVFLVWTSPSPGMATLRQFAPTRIPFILGAVLGAGFLLLRLHRLTGIAGRSSAIWPGGLAGANASPCSISTSTASSRSTTVSAIRRATFC